MAVYYHCMAVYYHYFQQKEVNDTHTLEHGHDLVAEGFNIRNCSKFSHMLLVDLSKLLSAIIPLEIICVIVYCAFIQLSLFLKRTMYVFLLDIM